MQAPGPVKRLLLVLSLLSALILPSLAGEVFYIGTYTQPGKSRGIYRGELDPATGALKVLGLAAESSNPSFLALHPGGHFLYAVNEDNKGTVSAFALQADGTLKELNRQSSAGGGPTHLSLDHAGRHALAANYNTGGVVMLPIGDDGRLGEETALRQPKGHGPNKQRQEGPHAHSVYVDASDRNVYSCDLGLDRVFHFLLDPPKGSLDIGDAPVAETAPGSGPRHLAFGVGEKFVYLVQEMSNTITVFARDPATGGLSSVQTIPTLPADFHGESSTAEIAVHPNGRLLYCTNRGLDSVAAFRIDAETGKLTPLAQTPTQGKGPRFFTIDPSGQWLIAANQFGNNLVVFRIDPDSGALTPTGSPAPCDQPVCVVFTSAAK